MFGRLMTLLVQGRKWYILPLRNSKCALLPSISRVYNLWKSSKSDVKFYVNGEYIDTSRKIGRFEMSIFKQMQEQNTNCQFITPYYTCVTADKSWSHNFALLGIILCGLNSQNLWRRAKTYKSGKSYHDHVHWSGCMQIFASSCDCLSHLVDR